MGQPRTSLGGTKLPDASSFAKWGRQLISLYLRFLVRLSFENCDDLYEYKELMYYFICRKKEEGGKKRKEGREREERGRSR